MGRTLYQIHALKGNLIHQYIHITYFHSTVTIFTGGILVRRTRTKATPTWMSMVYWSGTLTGW